MLNTSECRVIVEHAKAGPALPCGVCDVVQQSNLALRDVATGKTYPLPAQAVVTPIDSRRWRVTATGLDVQLLAVGKPFTNQDELEAACAALANHFLLFHRLPLGLALWCRFVGTARTPQGALITLSDEKDKTKAIPLTFSQVAALYLAPDVIEARAANGQGISLRRCRCARCGNSIDNPRELHTLENKFYCDTCYHIVNRELQRLLRSQAQRRVGVCRGCKFYALDYEGKSYGLSGKSSAVCICEERLAKFGPLQGKVESCVFRRPRSKGEQRQRIGTVGRLTREDTIVARRTKPKRG